MIRSVRLDNISFEKVSILNNKRQLKNTYQDEQSTNLSGYQAGQAILNRNNISFKNLTTPIETTHLYNKKTEGKDHLDLPNIHVYEFPDTNLQVIFNLVEDEQESQYELSISPSTYDNYNLLKQVLINKIADDKFKQNNLEHFYFLSIPNVTSVQSVITSSEFPLKIEDIPVFNYLLTSDNFSEDELSEAKKQIKGYLFSAEYDKDNNVALVLYKNYLVSKEDVLDEITQLKLDDVKKYKLDMLKDSKISATLTINKDYFENNKKEIFKLINKNLNVKFVPSDTDDKYKTVNVNKDIKVIHNNGTDNSVKMYYFISDNSSREFVIYEIISKIFMNFDKQEQVLQNKFIQRKMSQVGFKDSEMLESYRKLLVNSINKSFLPKPEYLSTGGFNEPFEYSKNFNINNVYGEYYQFYLENDSSNIEKLSIDEIIEQKQEVFKNILETDLTELLENIKQNFKNYLRTIILEEDVKSLQNLNISILGKDVFQVYEIIDDISQQDIKNVVKNYFLQQVPVFELNCSDDAYKEIKYNNSLKNNNINFKGNFKKNISTKKIKDAFVKKNIKIKNTPNKKELEQIPVAIFIPVIFYMKTKKEQIQEKLIKEIDKTNKTFTENYEKSVKELNKNGIDNNYEKYIDSTTGRFNQTGKNAINKEASKNVSHRGCTENIDEYNDDFSIDNDISEPPSDMQSDIIDVQDMDEGLCPDLQEIYDAPPIKSIGDLVKSIFGDITECLDFDWDFMSVLKTIAEEITDIGDWF